MTRSIRTIINFAWEIRRINHLQIRCNIQTACTAYHQQIRHLCCFCCFHNRCGTARIVCTNIRIAPTCIKRTHHTIYTLQLLNKISRVNVCGNCAHIFCCCHLFHLTRQCHHLMTACCQFSNHRTTHITCCTNHSNFHHSFLSYQLFCLFQMRAL